MRAWKVAVNTYSQRSKPKKSERPMAREDDYGSIHLLDSLGFRLHNRSRKEWESGCLKLSQSEAKQLIGKFIYFYKKQKDPSYFGGKILSFHVKRTGKLKGRVFFRFVFSAKCRGHEERCGTWSQRMKMLGVIPDPARMELAARKSSRPTYRKSKLEDTSTPIPAPEIEMMDLVEPKSLLPMAKQGDVIAQYKLGKAYALGLGVKHSYVNAVKWYRKAANKGNPDAQFSLGVAYDNGTGVKGNKRTAYRLFSLAASGGCVAAKAALEALGKPIVQKKKINTYTGPVVFRMTPDCNPD